MANTQRILQVLRDADKPLSTNTVADRAGVSWHTVDDELQDLYDRGEIDRQELSDRLTLWWDRAIPL